MRVFFIFLWVIAIFISTCTANFNGLVEAGMVRFQWDGDPDFGELLEPLPVDLSRDFLMQKSGHILAFFILTLLLHTKFKTQGFILILGISYSALTEFLQLFFTRDGRIFDIGFDTIGVLFALAIGSFLKGHLIEKTAKV